MIADALDNPPRSLVQYAEELREQLDWIEANQWEDWFRGNPLWIGTAADLRARLLAVEREINWRMGV